MSTAEKSDLIGMYRPTPDPPGFAIGVFRDGAGRLCVQDVAEDVREVADRMYRDEVVSGAEIRAIIAEKNG